MLIMVGIIFIVVIVIIIITSTFFSIIYLHFGMIRTFANKTWNFENFKNDFTDTFQSFAI